MPFHPAAGSQAGAPLRAVLYLRVSTGRQAAGDVSLPSQRELTRAFCDKQGWTVVEEFVEPGASATDDRRPVFQRMLEEAREANRPFDVIVVHSFRASTATARRWNSPFVVCAGRVCRSSL